ncbi:MAG: hypothetical protein QGG36_21135 [Pirellulaceae bacterium]|jgi:hypothetical protein|nr:hypothetical protein [Pirellulaceae bacterium]
MSSLINTLSTLSTPKCLALGLLVACSISTVDSVRGQSEFTTAPILYHSSKAVDRVAKMSERLESGKLTLKRDDRHGFLAAVLRELKVPIESQTLVFSKTSLQLRRITASRPRALYFNDDIYIGWVQGGVVVEVGAVDPQLGAVFYTIDQHADRAIVKRDQGECLACHATRRTQHVPGFLVRSVFAASDGQPFYAMGTTTTDHTTPIDLRFGGWYVSGKHGAMRHRGNVIARDDPKSPIDPDSGANVLDLAKRVDVTPYLAPTSDIIALMVLEHQTQMHNLVTRASYESRQAAHYDKTMNRVLERPNNFVSDLTKRRVQRVGDALLSYLLFAGEYELTAQVTGNSKFAKQFAARGPHDSKGRSLREFDLRERLFRYPCSFLIHTESFGALPTDVRDYVEEGLLDVLTGKERGDDFKHLTPQDRQAILEILVDTKPAFRKRFAKRAPQLDESSALPADGK